MKFIGPTAKKISLDVLFLLAFRELSDYIPTDPRQSVRSYRIYGLILSGEYTFHFHKPGNYPTGYFYIYGGN